MDEWVSNNQPLLIGGALSGVSGSRVFGCRAGIPENSARQYETKCIL